MKPLSPFTADETAALFARMLRARKQFFYLRYGDGALECINGLGRGRTCDGEQYSDELASDLEFAWNEILEGPNVYVGDWLSASFDGDLSTAYLDQYLELIGVRRVLFVHFEALLLMRQTPELLDFYRAAREDTRRKIYLGPAGNRAGAELLGARFVEAPMQGLHQEADRIAESLLQQDFEVFYWGAGMAGSIIASALFAVYPERTFINLGSALDPLFRGRSRSQQLKPAQAREFLKELL